MARTKKSQYTAQTQARAALVSYSRKELAELLGVSTRTLRRWANEGKSPRDADKRKSLDKFAARSRQSVTAYNKSIGAPPIKMAVPVRGERRMLIEYKDGRPVKDSRGNVKRYKSEWTNYTNDDRRLRAQDMLAILRGAADEGRTVQIGYVGAKTKDYPSGRRATEPIELDPDQDDDELLDMLFEHVLSEEFITYIGVL